MKSFSKLRCAIKLLYSSESVPLNKLQAFSGNDTNCALNDLSPATAIMNGSSADLRIGPVGNCHQLKTHFKKYFTTHLPSEEMHFL